MDPGKPSCQNDRYPLPVGIYPCYSLPMPMPISIPSMPVTVDSNLSTSSNPPPSYTTYPEDDRDRVVSPYPDSSSNSSCELLPLSPGPKTPPDKDSSAQSTPRSTPVHIDFITPPADIEMRHDEIPIHDERANTSNIQNEQDPFLFFRSF